MLKYRCDQIVHCCTNENIVRCIRFLETCTFNNLRGSITFKHSNLRCLSRYNGSELLIKVVLVFCLPFFKYLFYLLLFNVPLQNQREQNYTVLKTRSNMMTVDGLKPGTTYVFRVRARTDGGYGTYGGEIELETSHEGKTNE